MQNPGIQFVTRCRLPPCSIRTMLVVRILSILSGGGSGCARRLELEQRRVQSIIRFFIVRALIRRRCPAAVIRVPVVATSSSGSDNGGGTRAAPARTPWRSGVSSAVASRCVRRSHKRKDQFLAILLPLLSFTIVFPGPAAVRGVGHAAAIVIWTWTYRGIVSRIWHWSISISA